MELCRPSKPLILEAKCFQQENKAVICDLSIRSSQPLPLRGWISNVKPQAAADGPGTMCKINKQKGSTTESETWPHCARFWPPHQEKSDTADQSNFRVIFLYTRLSKAAALPINKFMPLCSFSMFVQTGSTNKPGFDENICTTPLLLVLHPCSTSHQPCSPVGATLKSQGRACFLPARISYPACWCST